MTVIDRFLKYIAIETASTEDTDTIPTSQKEFDLARVLVAELKQLGAEDVILTDNCYVYAHLSPNCDCNTKGIPADYDYLIKLHKILMFGLNDSCKDQLSEEQIIELNTMINQPTKCNTEVALDVMMFILDRRLFSDGDVRTAMMFANKIMLEGGNGVIIINSYNRDTFRKKLKEYHNNHDSGLKNWLYQNCIQGVKTDDFGY